MQVSHAMRERRSTRAFLPDAVPADTILQILDLAKWAPSWANTQGWNVYVLVGDALERLREEFEVLGGQNAPAETDLPFPTPVWPEYLAERMNYRTPPAEADVDEPSVGNFYNAPALLLFAIDSDLEPAYAAFDTGLLVQAFCLAAEDRGFATCIMARAVRYGDVLHEFIPEAEGQSFVIGVAFGLADHNAVVNRGERVRVELDEIATVIEDAE